MSKGSLGRSDTRCAGFLQDDHEIADRITRVLRTLANPIVLSPQRRVENCRGDAGAALTSADRGRSGGFELKEKEAARYQHPQGLDDVAHDDINMGDVLEDPRAQAVLDGCVRLTAEGRSIIDLEANVAEVCAARAGLLDHFCRNVVAENALETLREGPGEPADATANFEDSRLRAREGPVIVEAIHDPLDKALSHDAELLLVPFGPGQQMGDETETIGSAQVIPEMLHLCDMSGRTVATQTEFEAGKNLARSHHRQRLNGEIGVGLASGLPGCRIDCEKSGQPGSFRPNLAVIPAWLE